MARWLPKLLVWCLLTSAALLLIGRISWLQTVWRVVHNGEDLRGLEQPSVVSLLLFQVETGDAAVYMSIITLLIAIISAFYAPRFSKESRDMVASFSIAAVVFALLMIGLQV